MTDNTEIDRSKDNPKIKILVTELEAAMVKKIREFEFGTLTVHKIKGEPNRVEIGTSEMLLGRKGRELEIKDNG